ncbi:uncharacterized protein LOC118760849 [Octopus sinensis]|nr:uncharacterized protein LOC118760849 [Octopus sinensis]
MPSILVSVVLLAYMSVCMFTDTKFQLKVTTLLIFILGTAVTCVFIGGVAYVIIDFARETESKYQQLSAHYVLIILLSSVFYAAILHPRDCWMIFLGVFYMFMIPTMQILLPAYSLSNIVDQSWGTRDGNKATVPNLVCFPKIRKRRKKKRKKKEDKIPASLNSPPLNCEDECEDDVEYKFWEFLLESTIGAKARMGTPKPVIEKKLRRFRLKCIIGFLVCNTIWMAILGYLFASAPSEVSSLNLFGIINTSLFGISLIVQLTGLTVHRTQDTIESVIRKSNIHSNRPEWIITKDEKLDDARKESEK